MITPRGAGPLHRRASADEHAGRRRGSCSEPTGYSRWKSWRYWRTDFQSGLPHAGDESSSPGFARFFRDNDPGTRRLIPGVTEIPPMTRRITIAAPRSRPRPASSVPFVFRHHAYAFPNETLNHALTSAAAASGVVGHRLAHRAPRPASRRRRRRRHRAARPGPSAISRMPALPGLAARLSIETRSAAPANISTPDHLHRHHHHAEPSTAIQPIPPRKRPTQTIHRSPGP